MPFPFALPTTSSFAFSSSFSSDSHPSLPLGASTHRGVVRDALKKHKRLPPSSQASHVPSVVAALNSYLPYLLAVDAGLARRPPPGLDGTGAGDVVSVALTAPLAIEWRPTLSEGAVPVPGRERARIRIAALEWEVCFALGTLACCQSLQARAALHPLYMTGSTAAVGTQARTTAITNATKYLLDAASIYDFLTVRAESSQGGGAPGAPPPPPPCPDITPSAVRALRELAHAEATLLAVLKDDPYPAVVAQDRNAADREWMYKAPDIPKVRAHLFARLCLAAAEHAGQAHSLLLAAATGGKAGGTKISDGLVHYTDDLRRSSRAKACRFFGIDAELGGQTGVALAWLHAGLLELGVEVKDSGGKKSSGFGRLKKEWAERREDRKVEKETTWGADGGKIEETRVIEMLEVKWNKLNDTVRSTACWTMSSAEQETDGLPR